MIEWVVNRDQQDLLIEKVKDDLLDNRNPEINSIARRYDCEVEVLIMGHIRRKGLFEHAQNAQIQIHTVHVLGLIQAFTFY